MSADTKVGLSAALLAVIFVTIVVLGKRADARHLRDRCEAALLRAQPTDSLRVFIANPECIRPNGATP